MLKELTAASFAIALTLPAAALAGDEAMMDADGDGMVTAAEFEAAHPEAEAGTFERIDTNADGALAEDEVAAAKEAGVLPSEG